MFYTAGEQYAYSLIYTVARSSFDKEPASLEAADFKRAYQAWAEAKRPGLARATSENAVFVNDAALEENLLRPLAVPSPLDDRECYKEPSTFMVAARDRERIALDAAHVEQRVSEFKKRDPAYWDVWNLYVNYVTCLDSKYSWGGTNSEGLGVIYLIAPRTRSDLALYEIFVHEATHLMMFVDQERRPHYRSYPLMKDARTFVRSAIYERPRPMDKVLHSLVVATELLLHRDNVIGHDNDVSVHPGSARLAKSSLATAAQIMDVQRKTRVLAPRGVSLVETCAAHLEAVLHKLSAMKVA